MATQGYIASNISRNVNIPHGVRLFFKRSGTSTWNDLGDLGDVSVTPVAEFLEHFSNHDGRNALAKRILSNRGLTIEATLNEPNVENLRFAFFGGSATSGSLNVISTSTPSRTAGGTFVLPETPNSVISVQSESGETTYTVTTDYTVSSDTITIVTSSTLDSDVPNTGDKVTVTYDVAFASASTTKFTLLSDTSVSGAVQFQIRNQDGGLAQIIELDDCQVAPSGAVTVPADQIQQLPLTLTAQLVDSEFGRVYVKNV